VAAVAVGLLVVIFALVVVAQADTEQPPR